MLSNKARKHNDVGKEGLISLPFVFFYLYINWEKTLAVIVKKLEKASVSLQINNE